MGPAGGRWIMAGAVLALGLAIGGSAALAAGRPALEPGAKYVAMGSSFASGPRITTSADSPSNRCARSADNYAHQLARRAGLALTDVSCSGATTAHLLGPWNELPAQLEAVDAQTRLVTVTVGGNDVNYSRGLAAMGCITAVAKGAKVATPCGEPPPPPSEADYAALQGHLEQIAAEVRRRAPQARLVFVDYPAVLPPRGTCETLSLTPQQADLSRAIHQRVVQATARAARATGSGLVTLSALSADHHACSAKPWTNGYPAPEPPDGPVFHPKLAAHTAAAQALAKLLKL